MAVPLSDEASWMTGQLVVVGIPVGGGAGFRYALTITGEENNI
ncbi:hypothetical protein [Nocardia suismassiliense]|nr:hypothetical protein [Nocardia suismassiliense]